MGTDLEKTWTVTDQGSEQMSDGAPDVKVEKLDLVPRTRCENTFTHVTIWVDPYTGDIAQADVLYAE